MPQNNNSIKLSDVQEREASFFDEVADKFLALAGNDKESSLIVDVDRAIEEYSDYYQYAYKLLGDIKEKNILDMGCGSGKSSVILAKRGAFITAFDVSHKYVEVTRLRARINRVEDKIRCAQMTAEAMKYESNSFDNVFGVGVLHHIDIMRGGREIFRVLKDDGVAVFIEPIAFSPFLRKIRKVSLIKALIPNKGKEVLITEDERQINENDLKCLRKIFKIVEYKPFQLFSRLDRVIGGYPVTRGKRLISLINHFDSVLLNNFGFLSKFGRWGVIQLRK